MIRVATPLLAASALMLNAAHVAAQPPANGAPGGGPGGGFPGFARKPQQPQGFENMYQDPAKYTPEQKAAADVALRWLSDTNRKDLADQMAMVDDEIVYRGDPSETLGHGARGFCSGYNFAYDISWERFDELYVVAGPSQALVLIKRADMDFGPNGGPSALAGDPVLVATFARVSNGKLVEWLDAPINRVGGTVGGNSRAISIAVQPFCQKYPTSPYQRTGTDKGFLFRMPGPTPQPVLPTLNAGLTTYGTVKVESRMSADEQSTLQTVRAWFAARKASDPLLLAAFTDKNAVFRANSEAHSITNGRDALLKAVCATMNGSLDLTDVYVVGSDFDSDAIAQWTWTDPAGNRVPMGSLIRVQKGLVTEWMDAQLGGSPLATDPNSAACQKVNSALASFAPLPLNQQTSANAPLPGS
jgi:hypothetical protein